MSSLIAIIGAFSAGVIAALAAVVALRLSQTEAPASTSSAPFGVAPKDRQELEQKLRQAYESQIETASGNLARDLSVTSKQLTEQVSRLTTQVIETELEGYQRTLEEVRMVATQTMEEIHQAVEVQRAELRGQMESELRAERERLVAQFDVRLGDIVASYVTQSLGGGVDLGSQMQYISASLEENREALKKDLLTHA